MKNIIKLTCLLLTVCGFAGCTGNFDEYNTDPYALYKGDPAVLIPTMLDAMMYVQQNDSQMVDQMVGSLGGYFTLSNRWGGQNFDTFNASDAWNATPYNTMFEDIYANFFDIEKSTSKSGHYYAMARLVRAAVMMRVADCYGPIPYSKVADGSFYVEYDSAEDVYKHIIEDLAGAATTLYAYAQEYPASKPLANNDPIFAGDYTAWARLANSLCLRAAIRSNDREAAEERLRPCRRPDRDQRPERHDESRRAGKSLSAGFGVVGRPANQCFDRRLHDRVRRSPLRSLFPEIDLRQHPLYRHARRVRPDSRNRP